MIASQPRPRSGQLDAAVQALTMQVDRDTVLQARAALLGEALRLQLELRLHSPTEGVGRCGGDPVSSDAAPAFTERIRALILDCRQYVDDLEAAGEMLGTIAHSYGFTEDEIRASFEVK